MQIIAALIAINANINAIINAIIIRPFSENLAIKITFYIDFTSKNLKLVIKLEQKPINIAIITAIKKAKPKQKPININTAIIG